ncbi:MAG TPA: hypothetical protein VN642_03405 [Dongiaceae bacterium]|nr:hypothetical protein [Dongiaceae bacterium]
MENFIIRIYRREFSDISGLVEQVEMNEQRPFTCFDELRDILSLRVPLDPGAATVVVECDPEKS